MQKRHTDIPLYFRELETTTEKYLLPEIEKIVSVKAGMKVAEVGCSIGGNLFPFFKRGCKVYGIDIDAARIEAAKKLLVTDNPQGEVHLFSCDILKLEENEELKFDLIILRDVVEHLHDKDALMEKLKKHLSPVGIIYFAFPPWRMPFGGHQQICKSFISKTPWIHLLPFFIYDGMMKMMGEDVATRKSLRENRVTGISIRRFRKLIHGHHFKTISEKTFLVNPHYEVKFNLKPRQLPSFLVIPFIADFYSTAHSSIVKPG